MEADVTAGDSLILEAKQALLEEHHRRFQVMYKEGRFQEAVQQFNLTMSCATELLNDSLQLLERTIDDRRKTEHPSDLPPTTQ
jgi:hypothetical protein